MSAYAVAFESMMRHREAVVARLLETIPTRWESLASFVRDATAADMLGPWAYLPLAAADAAGGDRARAEHATAAWIAVHLLAAMLDNAADQDRPGAWSRIGTARASTQALGLAAVAMRLVAETPLPAERRALLAAELGRAASEIAFGQDQDLEGAARTVDECWGVMSRKNGRLMALPCTLGAMAVTDDPAIIDTLTTFGMNAGLAYQCLDDLEGAFFQETGDMAQGKVTLAVAYGLAVPHPAREALASLVDAGELSHRAAWAREVLDAAGTRRFLAFAASEAAEAALEALIPLRSGSGLTFLEGFMRAPFGRMAELVPSFVTEPTSQLYVSTR
jgi:geranylgeranyl diphosphate synthase type I